MNSAKDRGRGRNRQTDIGMQISASSILTERKNEKYKLYNLCKLFKALIAAVVFCELIEITSIG